VHIVGVLHCVELRLESEQVHFFEDGGLDELVEHFVQAELVTPGEAAVVLGLHVLQPLQDVLVFVQFSFLEFESQVDFVLIPILRVFDEFEQVPLTLLPQEFKQIQHAGILGHFEYVLKTGLTFIEPQFYEFE